MNDTSETTVKLNFSPEVDEYISLVEQRDSHIAAIENPSLVSQRGAYELARDYASQKIAELEVDPEVVEQLRVAGNRIVDLEGRVESGLLTAEQANRARTMLDATPAIESLRGFAQMVGLTSMTETVSIDDLGLLDTVDTAPTSQPTKSTTRKRKSAPKSSSSVVADEVAVLSTAGSTNKPASSEREFSFNNTPREPLRSANAPTYEISEAEIMAPITDSDCYFLAAFLKINSSTLIDLGIEPLDDDAYADFPEEDTDLQSATRTSDADIRLRRCIVLEKFRVVFEDEARYLELIDTLDPTDYKYILFNYLSVIQSKDVKFSLFKFLTESIQGIEFDAQVGWKGLQIQSIRTSFVPDLRTIHEALINPRSEFDGVEPVDGNLIMEVGLQDILSTEASKPSRRKAKEELEGIDWLTQNLGYENAEQLWGHIEDAVAHAKARGLIDLSNPNQLRPAHLVKANAFRKTSPRKLHQKGLIDVPVSTRKGYRQLMVDHPAVVLLLAYSRIQNFLNDKRIIKPLLTIVDQLLESEYLHYQQDILEHPASLPPSIA